MEFLDLVANESLIKKNETNQSNELLGEQYTRGKILSARLKVEESHPFIPFLR